MVADVGAVVVFGLEELGAGWSELGRKTLRNSQIQSNTATTVEQTEKRNCTSAMQAKVNDETKMSAGYARWVILWKMKGNLWESTASVGEKIKKAVKNYLEDQEEL